MQGSPEEKAQRGYFQTEKRRERRSKSIVSGKVFQTKGILKTLSALVRALRSGL